MPVTDPLDWLRTRVDSNALPGSAFEAAMKFAFLWMYFEGQACEAEANSKRLREFAMDLYAHKLDALKGKLDGPLEFFKSRYAENSQDSQPFLLRLGGPKRIKAADADAIILSISAAPIDEVDKAVGLLLICFRIRNNLFHGSKQLNTLQQQEELFAEAGYVLTALLEAR
jgi:hypothetical protein